MKFTVVLTKDPEDSGYNAMVPALPGCRTFGKTTEKAFENAVEAITSYLDSLVREGDPIPVEVETREVAVR